MNHGSELHNFLLLKVKERPLLCLGVAKKILSSLCDIFAGTRCYVQALQKWLVIVKVLFVGSLKSVPFKYPLSYTSLVTSFRPSFKKD